MDERRLTAWLITEKVLASDAVKRLLEEQIRLQRRGEKLDVIAVARRLDLLTDAQVADVLAKTGYTPPNGKPSDVVIRGPGSDQGPTAPPAEPSASSGWGKAASGEGPALGSGASEVEAKGSSEVEAKGSSDRGKAASGEGPGLGSGASEAEAKGSSEVEAKGSSDRGKTASGEGPALGSGASEAEAKAKGSSGWGKATSGEGPAVGSGEAKAESGSGRGKASSGEGPAPAGAAAPPPGPPMDERRLTAWLITEGVLSSDDVKRALEEQFRLEREGERLDVLAVARRLDLLGDAKMVEVLERTGYTPQPVAGGPSATGELDASADDLEGHQISDVGPVAAPAASQMDERRLTAWLITEGVLAADQVKASLEEQIRLQRQGQRLDILAVARRLGHLGDAKVAEVLERTGYKPTIHAAALPSGEVEAAADSVEAVTPVGGADVGSPPAKPGRASGAGRVPRRRRGPASPASMLATAVAIPVCALVFLVVFGRTSAPPIAAGRGGSTPPATPVSPVGPEAASAAAKPLLDELKQTMARLERTGASSAEVQELRDLIARLRGHELSINATAVVDRAERNIKFLSGEWREEEEARIEQARVDRAWGQLGAEFESILWACLDQRRSAIQLGAERVEGVDLARVLQERLDEVSEQSPDAIAKLAGSPDLHPLVRVGGYDALLAEAERFPEDLRESERWSRWKEIVPQFERLRDRASVYQRSILRAELASEMGDHEAALAAFSHRKFEDGRWFQAARRYLERPDVREAFARRAREMTEGGPGPVARRGGALPVPTEDDDDEGGGPATQVASSLTWQERFLEHAGDYKRASDDERPGVVSGLAGVMEETLSIAKRGFPKCKEVVLFYEEHRDLIEDEPKLVDLLRRHHQLYFEGAFAAASGPHTFRELDKWCEDWEYHTWRARLKPFLRLVAAAESRKARAREVVRRQRAEARERVAEFAQERLDDVAEGFGDVIRWMRRRGFAAEPERSELDDLIARGVERAGNPIAGARLREELRALEHTAAEEDLSRLRSDYRKQVEGVIDDAVRTSIKAVEKCLEAGEPGLAFDLFQYVLLLDPENDRAHKGLGHVEVDGRWLRRFEAERLRDGFAWDEEYGWIKAGERERYEAGEYYDEQGGGWTTIAAADQRHASVNDAWVFRTEHFELRSTADLRKTVQIATRLEAFYLAMFRQYDLFFAARGGAALIFGVAPSQQRPLVVNFYRDEQQFRAHANPPTGWAAGFYSGGQGASFFYDMGNAYSGVTVLQHEVTHQILGETSPGGAPAWLAEGAAVYLEDAFFRDGVLTLGEKRHHSRVTAYEAGAPSGNEHSLIDMLGFVTSADWDSGDISKNYRGAGAVVYFLCHFDDGRYRSDFVEFLRDSYYGKSPDIEDYFGMPVEVLNALMARFYDPDADIQLPGGADGVDLEAATDAICEVADIEPPDLDQLTAAYAMLRDGLRGAEERDARNARKKAARAIVSMRRDLVRVVERAARDAASGERKKEAYLELKRLREEALAIIFDTTRYPDANHGAAGQHLVDEEVEALQEFWERKPPELEEPEVVRALEALDATEPWLDELEVSDRRRGKTLRELREEVEEKTHPGRLAGTDEDEDRFERDRKVREYNAGRTDLPEEVREQVRVLNDYREMLGRHALAIERRLCESARKHSEWMESTGNFDHNQPNPGTRTPQDRAGQEGYTAPVGENIAFGYNSPEAVHLGWYNSSGHHRNMTSAEWHEIGVGRAGSYWTQNFGRRKPPFLSGQ